MIAIAISAVATVVIVLYSLNHVRLMETRHEHFIAELQRVHSEERAHLIDRIEGRDALVEMKRVDVEPAEISYVGDDYSGDNNGSR